MYYGYTSFLLAGTDLSVMYDVGSFNNKLALLGFGDVHDIPNNPPTAALYLLPLIWLPPVPAKIMWGILSVLFLFLSIRILFRTFQINATSETGILLTAIILISTPLNDNLLYGQVYTLLLWLLCLSLEGLHKYKTYASSLPLSFSSILKGYGILPLIWFGLKKNRRGFTVAFAGILLIGILLLPVFPLTVWMTFLRDYGLPMGTRPSDADVAYQTINGFVRHFCSFDQRWSPQPILNLPGGIVSALAALLDVGCIVLVFFRSFSSEEKDEMFFARLMALSVITAPLAEDYHYLLMFVLVTAMSSRLTVFLDRWNEIHLDDILYGLAVILLIAPFPYKSLDAAAFPTSLLAYPRLYGGIMLITISFAAIPRHPQMQVPVG